MQVRVTCKLHLREQCIEPWPVKKAHTAYDTMNRHTCYVLSLLLCVWSMCNYRTAKNACRIGVVPEVAGKGE